jgi:hypothetical protein
VEIQWTTNEESTSQVKYWASPESLSPLDETAVAIHTVKIGGLAPYTTYHFTVISRDRANNLAESGEYTFTTQGEPATFTLSNLRINLAKARIGEAVIIRVTVKNIGDVAGSYDATLNIIAGAGFETMKQTVLLGAGASEDVSFVVTKKIAGVFQASVSDLTGLFTVIETPSLAPQSQPKISLLSINPSYDDKTLNPISTKITYLLENLTEPVTDAELILRVTINGEQLEDVVLVSSDQLLSNDIRSLDYTPPLGWQSGTYTFRAELYLGGNLCASTSEERLEIKVKPVAVTVSWSTLAMIIGATVVVTGIMLGVILHRRRQIIGNWVEDNRS